MVRSTLGSKSLSRKQLISKKLLVAPFLLAFVSVGACSSLSGMNLPFGSKKSEINKKDDGRIAVLGVDEELKPDEALAGIGAVVPPSLPVSSWSNSAGTAGVTPENISGDGSLSVAWKKKVGAGAGKSSALIGQPIIADGNLYVLDANMVLHGYTLDGVKKLWSANLAKKEGKGGWLRAKTGATAGGIGYDNGVIVASSGYGEVIGVNATDGSVKWRFASENPVHSAPLVVNGRAYVVSVSSQLFALDANSCDLIWTQSGITESARVLSSSSSVIQGDTLVTPFASGEVIASLTANGRRLWNESLSRVTGGNSLAAINDIAGHPVISDGVVYAVSQSGLLAAIDIRSGVRIWEKSISSIQSPWIAGGYLYIVSVDSELFCIEKASGKIVWTKQLEKYKNAKKRKNKVVWTGPVMVEGHLVLGSSLGNVVEIDPVKGDVLNTIKAKEDFYIAPIAVDGTVYFLAKNGTLVALK